MWLSQERGKSCSAEYAPCGRKQDGLYYYSLLVYLLRFLTCIKQGKGVGRTKPRALGFCPQIELDPAVYPTVPEKSAVVSGIFWF